MDFYRLKNTEPSLSKMGNMTEYVFIQLNRSKIQKYDVKSKIGSLREEKPLKAEDSECELDGTLKT